MNCEQREALAAKVVEGVQDVCVKLATLEADIRLLWSEFEALRGTEPIAGCYTKKEFCERVLHRSPRAVRYMLDGGNHNRRETVSPADGPLAIRKRELFGENCEAKHAEEIEKLKDKLAAHGVHNAELSWRPLTSAYFGVCQDRYTLTIHVSKTDVEKISELFRPQLGVGLGCFQRDPYAEAIREMNAEKEAKRKPVIAI